MITVISGTNRTGSVSAQVAAFVAEAYVDLAELPLETLSPDAYVEKPARVLEFIDQILASSGLVVIVPEYNGSMPGVLKLFIDMLPFPESFEERPVSYVGLAAGQFGGLRPRGASSAGLRLPQRSQLSPSRLHPRRRVLEELHALLRVDGRLAVHWQADHHEVAVLEPQALITGGAETEQGIVPVMHADHAFFSQCSHGVFSLSGIGRVDQFE